MADDLLDQRQAATRLGHRHHEPWKPGASATGVRAKTGRTRPPVARGSEDGGTVYMVSTYL